MYDAISNNYDRFVNWTARLSAELPFIEQQLQITAGAGCRVLDAACGTGMHTLALAQLGYRMSGADVSPGMIQQARSNAASAGGRVRFEVAGFGELAHTFDPQSFDALICLGNSLPHIPGPADLASILADFAACLQPGGLLLIQNRNFDAVLAQRQRWMEPQAYQNGEEEWLFLRFYDFDQDGLLSFHMITLHRQGTSSWSQEVNTTRLYPLQQAELISALLQSGFENIASFGGMSGTPFDPITSGNLVIAANLKKSY